MNQGKYVFSQVADFLPRRVFDRCVARYAGNKWTKHFTCWNQLLCMMYGQLSARNSMRDLMTCLGAHHDKYYHLGFGHNVSRTNLRNANKKRDWRIFEMFAMELIAEARRSCLAHSEFALDVAGAVYAFDSTTIDLCLNVFWWATFRRQKGGVKLHTMIDVRTEIPTFVLVTPASVHDVNALDSIDYETGAYYVLDRAYVDFARLHTIHLREATFVTRAKDNMRYRRVSRQEPDHKHGVLSDLGIELVGFYAHKDYPVPLRRVRYYDQETRTTYVFLTNNFTLKALDIARLYKYRWSIELFFKWIKQHLQVQSFWGTTDNAVRTQIYTAIVTYTLISMIKHKMHCNLTTYEVLQIIGTSLLDKSPLRQLLTHVPMDQTPEIQFSLDFV